MKQSSIMNIPQYREERKSELTLPSSPYANRNRIYTVGVNNQNINHFAMTPPPLYKGSYQTNNHGNMRIQTNNLQLNQSTVLGSSRQLNQNNSISQLNQVNNLQKQQILRHMHSASDLNQGVRGSSSIRNSMIANQNPRIQDTNLGSSGYRAQNTNLFSSGHPNQNSYFGSVNPNNTPQTERNQEFNNFSKIMIHQQFAGFSSALKQLSGKIEKMSKKMNKNSQRITIVQRICQLNSTEKASMNESDLNAIKQKISSDIKKQNALNANISTDIQSYMIRQEIEKVRKQLKQFVSKDCNQRVSSAVKEIKDSYSYNNQTLDFSKRLNLQISSLKQEVRNQIKYVHSRLSRDLDNHLQLQLSTISEQIKKSISDAVKMETKKMNLDKQNIQMQKSSTQYAFKPLLLKYQGILRLESQRSAIQSIEIDCQQRIYYIDNEGYLLDQQRYYILDTKGEKIRIPAAQVSKLKGLCLF